LINKLKRIDLKTNYISTMNIKYNQSLTQYNTFKVNVNAEYFVNIKTEKDLVKLLNQKEVKKTKKFILGGGSNILFTKDIKGLVIYNQIKGIKIEHETDDDITIEVGAGEIWDDLVKWSVSQELYGIENLSLIPGQVGAAPIQNIGAYGVELKDVFKELRAISLTTNKLQKFNHKDCQFGYRNSIFKKQLKEQYIITKIKINLSKKPKFNTNYKSLQEKTKSMDPNQLTSQKIREIIINIRNSKLPNPKNLGNAGSFFKNPMVNIKKLQQLKEIYPKIPFFQTDKNIKIAAAWLIEQLQWKGYINNNCGVYDKHSLVLINHGNAKGTEIASLSKKIKQSVKKKFNITLEEEVLIL